MTSMGFSLGVWNILLHQSAPPGVVRTCPPGYDKRIYAGEFVGVLRVPLPRPQRGIGCYGADKFSPGEAGTFCGALAVTRR